LRFSGSLTRIGLDLGRWQETLAVTVLPAGMGAALLVWAGRVGKRRADGAPSATT